ncbi:MAG TPA: hypothetical protein VN578_02525 [Candidatus Binatia bacterium]|jgi:hypothetical protein|nr:hypothetical protein [Candidatus Binatia bacterium]
MNLLTSTRWAKAVETWLAPHCTRLQIAGSIRRESPLVNDIDIVCIPKVTEEKDMLGSIVRRENHVLNFLTKYVHEKPQQARFISGWDADRKQDGKTPLPKQVMLELPKCQLDLWFAEQANFATRLLCRTGSKEHNTWFADRCTDQGLHWFPYEGIAALSALQAAGITVGTPGAADRARETGLIMAAESEIDLYAYAGLAHIPAQNREAAWLAKNIDSGL